jgi:hypothetical protein
MNLTYTGTIRSIGPKTVAIVAYEGTSSEKVIKLDLEQFSHLNEYFDLAKIQRRNSEWMD